MKLHFTLLISIVLTSPVAGVYAQAPGIEWQKCYGGTGGETGRYIEPTTDGGYIMTGSVSSSDGDVVGAHGGYDFWVVKINSVGGIQWQKCLGGKLSDESSEVHQTRDGGYIVVGASESGDGDVIDHHGMADDYDCWVVKLSSTGNIEWTKSFGGTKDDIASSIQQTTDGGYILVGRTMSNDGDVTGYHDKYYDTYDYLVIKMSSTGSIQWQKCFGGTANDQAYSVRQTPDGGYLINGASQSTDGDINPDDHSGSTTSHWSYDYWVIKLDGTGYLEWERSLGGSNDDYGQVIQLTTDGGYILGGRSASNDKEVSGNHLGPVENYDFWIIKIDDSGNLVWQKCFGGTNFEDTWSIKQTTDGGYIVAGEAHSNDGDVNIISMFTNPEVWVIKLTATGVVEWKKTYGGPGWDGAYSICQTNDNGYILVGYVNGGGGDVTNFHGGYGDVWVVKLKGAPCVPAISITASSSAICSGDVVTFSSLAVNGGSNPGYQWKINGVNAGTDSSGFTSSSLKNNDSIFCVLTSSAVCATSLAVVSDTIVIKVNDPVIPSVSITASSNVICPATDITFTAANTNAGPLPYYQWKVNGVNAGANQPQYNSNALKNGDAVSCTLSVDPAFTCFTTSIVNSNIIEISVTDIIRPSVKIQASDSNICRGSPVAFLAQVVNGNGKPFYEWKVNDALAGSNLPSFTTIALKNGDKVYFTYTAENAQCTTAQVNSDTVLMIVNDPPHINLYPADTTVNSGNQIQIKAVVLADVASFEWSPASKLVQPLSLSPFTNPINGPQVFSLKVTNAAGCKAEAISNIKILVPLLMPGAFTPNKDGVNDIFRVPQNAAISLKEFSIFNRWGEEIFNTNDKSKGWDGTYGGKDLEAGTYIYVVKGLTLSGDVFLKGTVTLIR